MLDINMCGPHNELRSHITSVSAFTRSVFMGLAPILELVLAAGNSASLQKPSCKAPWRVREDGDARDKNRLYKIQERTHRDLPTLLQQRTDNEGKHCV